MGNSSNLSQVKSQGKKAMISKLFSLVVILFCSLFCVIGCKPEIPQNSANATYDANGNLRVLTPQLVYNYSSKDVGGKTTFGEDANGINSGSFSWNLSYYAKNVYSPEADEQYLGVTFYTDAKAIEILGKANPSKEEKEFLQSKIYKGSSSAVAFNGTSWFINDPNSPNNGQTLYRFYKSEIEFPNYEVVVDGVPLYFELHVDTTSNEPLLIQDSTTKNFELNINKLYFTYRGENERLSNSYIKIIKNETQRDISSAENGVPFSEYSVVFNPILKGTNLTRTIKVKALARDGSKRGDSPYSSTITYQASKLVFQAYSPNSASDLSEIGYLEYNDSEYASSGSTLSFNYFTKIKNTVSSEEEKIKPIYLEGYFPEGKVVEVSRKRFDGNNSDYALSSWTTNSSAKYTSFLQGTLPVSIDLGFNTISNSNKALVENDNVGVFAVKTYYSNENAKLGYLERTDKVTTVNNHNLFIETLNIENSQTVSNVANTNSVIKVVSLRSISGYTFYANFAKVKNFTQSGTVFAGDDFFNGNSNHYLTGYTLSIYTVSFDDKNGYKYASAGVLDLTSLNAIYKSNTSDTFNYNVTKNQIVNTNIGNGTDRIITISIKIDGSAFEVSGLEHNMALVFDKSTSNTDNDTSGVKTNFTFHNATMSSVRLGEAVVKSLFVCQSDRVLCGVIGTEYAESSNIKVNIMQVDDNNHVGDVASDVKYEIIKSVTTKEDIHGYVTTNIILSVIVPENHMLVSYNVETPLISSQIMYKLCGCEEDAKTHTCTFKNAEYVYYNATTDTYYKTTGKSISGVKADGTNNYLMYDDGINKNIYAYSHRDSSYNAITNRVSYNSYYYGNYEYDANDKTKLLSFQSLVVTVTGNNITYTLLTHTPLNDFTGTKCYDDNGNVIDFAHRPNNFEETYINSLDEARTYLESNLPNVNSGILIDNSSLTIASVQTVYYFTRTNTNLTVERYIINNETNGDISTHVTAYKSALKYFEQDVYFYYDVATITRQGKPTHYYTAPIGRQMADGTPQWFYNFTNQPTDIQLNLNQDPNIKLGRTILESIDKGDYTYQNFYDLLGQKIVNHYYYYVTPVEEEKVQARQYSDRGEAILGFEFYKPDGSKFEDFTRIQVENSNTAVYREITIDNETLQLYFNPTSHSFSLKNNKNEDVTANYSFSFDFVNGGQLFDNSGAAIMLAKNGNGSPIYDISSNLFEGDPNHFKNSGIYEARKDLTGATFTFTVAYMAVEIASGKQLEATFNGTYWFIDGSEARNEDLNKYYIFPEFNINSGDAFLKISKNDDKSKSCVVTESSKIVSTAVYYYMDGGNKVYLRAESVSGDTTQTKREAFTLDPNTNQKTQIMIWGKYIPTNDPNDPIIYPSFSSLLKYDDVNTWLFDPVNGFYYDIDYSSPKAYKEGFLGSSWLAGAPYPNPVLYLSVRHKINEYAEVNLALEIKSVFFAEIMADKIENDSSNLVLDFSTYSFKDTFANIDANDYIDNIYYVLERNTLTHINAFKLVENETNGRTSYTLNDLHKDKNYKNGLILKINEISIADDGTLYWTDAIDANGQYLNKVYVETNQAVNTIRIETNGVIRYFRPLYAEECFAWKTSKKYVKDVGYFDVHGYSEDLLTGQIVFNSGELEINDVCKGLNGLVLGTISNNRSEYNYDQVIIAGTSSAYRTNTKYANNAANTDSNNLGFFGFTQQGAIPIIDSYDTNDTYFLMGKECLMLIADPIINTNSKTYYRFLEWRIYSRYNSGILYYDRAENERQGNNIYSSTLMFSPQFSGHYVILPVYQRVFEVAVATEVENGPQNQGGSVIVYYKDGKAVNIDESTQKDAYTLEYLKTNIGGKLGYYYNDISFTPYVYFDIDGNIDTSLKQVFKIDYFVNEKKQNDILEDPAYNNATFKEEIKNYFNRTLYFGLFVDSTGYESVRVLNFLSEKDLLQQGTERKNCLCELTFTGLRYYLKHYDETTSNKTVTEQITSGIAFEMTTKFSQPLMDGSLQEYELYLKDGYLYIIDFDVTNTLKTNFEGDNRSAAMSFGYDADSPIAKNDISKVNVVEIMDGITSAENGYSHIAKNDLLAGQEAYDKDGNLKTYLSFKTNYIDRGSRVMLQALPDEGYRLLGWYTVDGKSLEDLFGKEVRTYSSDDKILKAYYNRYDGNYYYKRKGIEGNYTYEDVVPKKMLSKVRGLYINQGSKDTPSYVEVFYSPARDAYYYDSTYTIQVEDKYIYEEPNSANNYVRKLLVEEKTHISAITEIKDGEETYYFLNGVQVYKQSMGEDFEYYTAYSTGNIEVSGNSVIIKSLHSHIKFVAVFKEIYQSMILTDSEEEFGISIEGIYYFNKDNNDLANRIDENGNIIKIDDEKNSWGTDRTATSLNITSNNQNSTNNEFLLFTLFEYDKVKQPGDAFGNKTIGDLGKFNSVDKNGKYNGYVALTSEKYSNSANAWDYYVKGNGMSDKNGNPGKRAIYNEGEETFALKNLYFDENTTALIVVRTLSSAPLQLHTLGLPSDYNLQPIIYPSDEYITSNSQKSSLGNTHDNVNNYRADYLYYVFELTYNRDPENEYADLLVHPTREISTTLDIATGNYLNFYSKYYEVELSYTGTAYDTEGQPYEKTNSVFFNLGDYFETISVNNKNQFKLKNNAAFVDNVVKELVKDIILIKDPSGSTTALFNEIEQNITGYNQSFTRIVDFIDYLNTRVLKNTEQKLNISGIRINKNYVGELVNKLSDSVLSDEKKANLQAEIDIMVNAGLIEEKVDAAGAGTKQYTSLALRYKDVKNQTFDVGMVYSSLAYLLVENEKPTTDASKPTKDSINPTKTEEYYNSFAFVRKYEHTPVGDGVVNLINFTAITMYTFSIESLTIDGYDENGNIIYSKDNAHELGSTDGSFNFYTAVGTNNRTYMGGVPSQENFTGMYYNGTLTSTPVGIRFTNWYSDANPDYQTEKNLPNYVYKDFLLAKNTLLLIEGLAKEETNPGYQFMGWYQQKKLTSITDRFYDLDGTRLNIIDLKNRSDYKLSEKDGKLLIKVGNEYKEVENPTGYKVDEDLTQWLFYVDEKTNTLYRQDGLEMDKSKYEYREWSSMELVSTTYRYPYVATANADTIITALFKRVVELSYSFNPLEMTVTSSTSVDGLNNPLRYSVYMNKDGLLSTVCENILNKQEAYERLTANYNTNPNATFEMKVTGNFYIDATPTFTITPVGGYRLDKVYNLNSDHTLGEQIDEFNGIKTVVKYSNKNSLKDTDVVTILKDENPVSTYDSTNLAGIVYTTFVINNLFNTASNDAENNSLSVAFTAKRVTMVYSRVEGYLESYKAKAYDFMLAEEIVFEEYTDEDDKIQKRMLSAEGKKLFYDTQVLKDDYDLTTLLPANKPKDKDGNITDNRVFTMTEGFLDEWIFKLFYNKIANLSNRENKGEINKDFLTEEQITAMVLADSEYNALMSKFSKTSANAYVYVAFEGNNLMFYCYFDSDFTEDAPLVMGTNCTTEETAIDHWYINAQTPSSVSGSGSDKELNDGVTFPTRQEIWFAKPTNTGDETTDNANKEYNGKYALSSENLVYHLKAVIETSNKETVSITLQDNFNEKPFNLADLNTGNETTDDVFENTINFTFTGIRYANFSTDRDIDTTANPDNTNANGTIKTKYHEGRYGTNTNFVFTIEKEFLVISKTKTYPNGKTLTESDIYAFIGWTLGGTLVSTDLSFETTTTGTVEARFVKIARVEFVNGDSGELINMQQINITSTADLGNQWLIKGDQQSTIFGFYPFPTTEGSKPTETGFYYALVGIDIHVSLTPDEGFVLESVSYADKDFKNETLGEFKEIINIAGTPTGFSFTLNLLKDSQVKLNIREGYKLTINQIVFNDYMQTTKGNIFNGATLYNLYKNGKLVTNGARIFAQGSKIKLEFAPKQNPYAFIGWFVNNKLVNGANSETVEFDLNENTVVELRVVPILYLNIKASDSVKPYGTNLITGVEIKLDNVSPTSPLYTGQTPVSNIAFKAGQKLNVNITNPSTTRTFLGWYYMNGTNPQLVSTNPNYIFTINANNPYVQNNNITLVAVFAITKQITISKTIEKQEQDSRIAINDYDVTVTYTNANGNKVSTNLGNSSKITINALSGTALEIELKAEIAEDMKEKIFFEGFRVNDDLKTYEENAKFNLDKITSGSEINANFLQGNVVTLTRRLNDDPYKGDNISLGLTYNISTLSSKELSGDKEFIELGFKSETSSGLTLTKTIKENSNIYFIGWFINNEKVVGGGNYIISDNGDLTITNAKDLPDVKGKTDSPKVTAIEARFAETAIINLSRNIDGDKTSSDLQKTLVTANYNQFENRNVTFANLVLNDKSGNDKTTENGAFAYKYTSIALTASRLAGYEFIGFMVNNKFITKTVNGKEVNNTDDVVYFYLGNENGTPIHEYKIEAYYSKQYTINVISTFMGTSGNATITAPQTISEYYVSENSTISAAATSSDAYFVGFYGLNGNLLTGSPFHDRANTNSGEITLSNAVLKANALDNRQIIIEARFAKVVYITVNTDGHNFTNECLYGVTTSISGGNTWILQNPDGSFDPRAPYATGSSLKMLPLENKTYYSTNEPIGTYSHHITITSVLNNGMLKDNNTYSPIDNNNKSKFVTVTHQQQNIPDSPITSLSVNFEEAIKAGYAFIGWVAGAKYINSDGLHYLPISNELTIDVGDTLYNDIFAVFANATNETSDKTIQLNSDSHLGSFVFNANLSLNLGSIRNFYVDPSNGGTTTIRTFANASLNGTVSPIDGYTLTSSPNTLQGITTERELKEIKITKYTLDTNNSETRVGVVNLTDENVKVSDSSNSASDTVDTTTLVTKNVTITTKTQNGTVNISGLTDNTATTLDNIFVTSTPNDGYYLAYYKVTRVMDNGTKTTEYIYGLKHITVKVLDGDISIEAVFRKTFNLNIDNTVKNITDQGNTTVTDITKETDDLVTKQLEISAKENYRISGLVIDGTLHTIPYTHGEDDTISELSKIKNDVNDASAYKIKFISFVLSDPDEADYTQNYITNLTVNFTSDIDINVAVVYTKVANITLVEEKSVTGGNNSYLLYADATNLSFNSENYKNATNKEDAKKAFTLSDNFLTASKIKNLKNIEGNANSNPKFLGYYYQNEALPNHGLNISGNTEFEIVAKFAKNIEIDVSFGLYYDSTLTKKINIFENGEQKNLSLFNTPLSGFAMMVTKLKSNTSSSTDVETQTLLSNVWQSAQISFYENDNLALNAKGNKYFVFDYWKDNKDNKYYNPAISPNTLTNVTELEAVFHEETRQITLNPNYEGGDILIGETSTQTFSLSEVLEDITNVNKTIALSCTKQPQPENADSTENESRNLVVSKNSKGQFVLTYSVASSELGDTFYIIDGNFKPETDYYTLTHNEVKYKFKNFTQQNDKILRGYNYVKGGKNAPSATVYLQDFYQNQTLNINAISLVNIQYTFALPEGNIININEVKISVTVNDGTPITIAPQNINVTYQNAIINIWVETGDIVRIKANIPTTPVEPGKVVANFITIGYSTVNPLIFKIGETDYLNLTNNSNAYLYPLTTPINGVSKDVWNLAINGRGQYVDLINKFVRENKAQGNSSESSIARVSDYTFIAKENIYFVADYIPVFTFNTKYINAVLSATDLATKLASTSGLASNGHTLGIIPQTPNSPAEFEFLSNSATILNLLDKNNNLIGLETADSTDLTKYYLTTNEDFDESYGISTKQTENIETSSGFGENGIKAIIEQLANVSVTAGTINATQNGTNASTYVFNHYQTLFDEYLKELANELNKLYKSEEFTKIDPNNPAFDFVNDIQVSIEYMEDTTNNLIENFIHKLVNETDKDVQGAYNMALATLNQLLNYLPINPIFKKAYLEKLTSNLKDYSKEIISFVQQYIKVGTTVKISTNVANVGARNNYFFKGFMIVNSASQNNINLFADGKVLEHNSGYSSYTIIPASKCTEVDGTFSTEITLSGDTQVIALYERMLLQVEVRMKNLSENLQSIYTDKYNQNLSDLSKLNGQTISGIDIDKDSNSSSGKLASTTTTIVEYGKPAIVTTINYPFAQLIGWASTYTPIEQDATGNNLFAVENGETKDYNSLPDSIDKYDVKFEENTLILVDPSKARNNLYVNHVTQNLVVAAYFNPMQYTISIEIKETDLAGEYDKGEVKQTGFVSIKEDTGNKDTNGKPIYETSYIETYFDQYGKAFKGASYKVKVNLIDVVGSLVPYPYKLNRIITENGNIVDYEKSVDKDKDGNVINHYYLRYLTGEFVINGDSEDGFVEIFPNEYQVIDKETGNAKVDENGKPVMERVALNEGNFYKETNVTLYNYSTPTNLNNYFVTEQHDNRTNLFIKPGLIKVSYNNKPATDLHNAFIPATPVDKDGNVILLDNRGNQIDEDGNIIREASDVEIATYVVNLTIGAKANVGFPTVKIITGSPTDDPSIIPYTFDDSDYLNKYMEYTNKKSINELSQFDRNINHDISMVSGFYNRIFENTTLFTDKNFSYSNLNFKLVLIYARKATPLEATVNIQSVSSTNGTSREVVLTSRSSNRQTLLNNISLITKNVIRYDYYIVENGAFFTDALTSYLATTQNNNEIQTCMKLLDLFHNFPKYAKEAGINEVNGQNLLTLDKIYSQAKLVSNGNGLTGDDISNMVNKLINEGYLASNFNYKETFTIKRIDVLGWFTGQKVAKTVEENIAEAPKNAKGQELLKHYIKGYSIDEENGYATGSDIRANYEWENIYNNETSSHFNEFYVKSGDSVVTFVNLAMKFQNQQPTKTNAKGETIWAKKAHLYYNDANLTYEGIETFGLLAISYSNNIKRVEEMLSNSQEPSTWEEVKNFFSALFNAKEQYAGTFISDLISSCNPTGHNLNEIKTIVNKLTIDENVQLATLNFPFWIGEVPFGNEIVEIATFFIVAIGSAIAITATIASGGAVGAIIGALPVLMQSLIVGGVSAYIGNAVSKGFGNIDWTHLVH